MGPPEVLEVLEVGEARKGELGAEIGVEVEDGGRVSQERVRRQLARRTEKELEEIGSWVDVYSR